MNDLSKDLIWFAGACVVLALSVVAAAAVLGWALRAFLWALGF